MLLVILLVIAGATISIAPLERTQESQTFVGNEKVLKVSAGRDVNDIRTPGLFMLFSFVSDELYPHSHRKHCNSRDIRHCKT
jgi:hypothetical protein